MFSTISEKINLNPKVGVAALSLIGLASIYQYSQKKQSKKSPHAHHSTEPITVFVTGAAGQIGYAFIPLLLTGQVFGQRKINLRLLDVAFCEDKLKGIELEIQDGAYHLLESIETGSDPMKMFRDADVGIFIGGFPRKDGMQRKDLLTINGKIFIEQGKALDAVAKKTCKCIVVANPANTNCLILSESAPSIPKENFTALTRLDQNRAVTQIAMKANTHVTNVNNVIIWGNHSSTQYPDVSHGTVLGKAIREVISDDEYLNKDFIVRVQNRGGEIIKAKQTSSVFSAANALKDHLHDWYFGTKPGHFVSMAVPSDGSYGVPAGIIFSFPVTTKNFTYSIVQGLPINEFSQGKLNATSQELLAEKSEALSS